MSTSYDNVFSVLPQRIIIGVGATAAQLFDASTTPGANSIILKYFSGGTLEILGVTTGVTLSAAELIAAAGSGYIMGSSEILNIGGPVRLYLAASGATTIVHAITMRSQGQ